MVRVRGGERKRTQENRPLPEKQAERVPGRRFGVPLLRGRGDGPVPSLGHFPAERELVVQTGVRTAPGALAVPTDCNHRDRFRFFSSLPFFKIIVPTVDTVRYNYLVAALTGNQRPVLLVGPVGTGKTSTVQKVLDAFDKNKFLILTINMSAQTTVHNIQETLDGRLEKRTKDLYMPLASKPRRVLTLLR